MRELLLGRNPALRPPVPVFRASLHKKVFKNNEL